MRNKINASIFLLVKNVCILVYMIGYIKIAPFYGLSTAVSVLKSLVKRKKCSEDKEVCRKEMISKFVLNTSKRHKEALAIRKYRMTGTSTVARHYALEGRNGGRKKINKVTMLPRKEIVLPARRCMVLGKMDNWKARKISKSGIRTHRIQRLNLIKKRIYFEKEDRFVKLKVSTKGLKTIKKFGLEYCCEKFKLNLKKKKVDGGRSTRRKKKQKLNESGSEKEKELWKERTKENYEEVSKLMPKLNNQNASK